MIALITCAVLIGLMLLGVPVCAAMGGTAAAMFTGLGYREILAVMAQRVYNGTTSFTMLAIPFFILAGNLMNTGGITDRIFNFAKACVGHWPGGLGQVNIFSSFNHFLVSLPVHRPSALLSRLPSHLSSIPAARPKRRSANCSRPALSPVS